MDVLQAGAAGSRAPVRDRHPRDAAVPALAGPDRGAASRRPHRDRGAGLVVPAGHPVDRLSPRARQELGGDRGDRRRRGTPALLPQHRSVRARRRRLPGQPQARRPHRRDVAPAVPRDRALRRRTAARRRRADGRLAVAVRGALRSSSGVEPVRRGSATRSRLIFRACSQSDHAYYHTYAFATVRMAGSAFEACAAHVEWLFGADGADAARSLATITSGSKAMSFKLARRRAFDVEAACAPLAAAWDDAIAALSKLLG